jgi:hypothetical protein
MRFKVTSTQACFFLRFRYAMWHAAAKVPQSHLFSCNKFIHDSLIPRIVLAIILDRSMFKTYNMWGAGCRILCGSTTRTAGSTSLGYHSLQQKRSSPSPSCCLDVGICHCLPVVAAIFISMLAWLAMLASTTADSAEQPELLDLQIAGQTRFHLLAP